MLFIIEIFWMFDCARFAILFYRIPNDLPELFILDDFYPGFKDL